MTVETSHVLRHRRLQARATRSGTSRRCSTCTPTTSSSSRSIPTTRQAPRAPATARDVLRGMFEHCAAAGVQATVQNTIAETDRAAATITCQFPGGRRCSPNAILELEDGRIVREIDVLWRPSERRARHAEGIQGNRFRARDGRGLRGPLRALRRRLDRRVRDLHAGRRPVSPVQGTAERRVPVRAHGLRHQGQGRVPLRR